MTLKWAELSPSEKMNIFLETFTQDWQELEVPQLAKIAYFAKLEGYLLAEESLENMFKVLQALEESGAIVSRENSNSNLEVKINGSR